MALFGGRRYETPRAASSPPLVPVDEASAPDHPLVRAPLTNR